MEPVAPEKSVDGCQMHPGLTKKHWDLKYKACFLCFLTVTHCKTHFLKLFAFCFPPGKWFGQGRTWWSSGGGHQARPYRCPGSPTYPHQSRGGCRTKRHQLTAGRVCGRCVHANRHHLWTYYGTGQASACYPTSPWHLSLPAVWQVRASIYVKVNEC